ncbi:MAG TPA: response regulator [Candidatus Dormibacteraeota bacterium]|nr:response regulator [Candidatus Dormibacteraeota bacterium]
MAVSVLIVDDHEEFRSAARRLLKAGGLDMGDLTSARAAVRRIRPRVALLDVQLPDGDGIDAAADLC